MFSLIGDTIYYGGREFATVKDMRPSGWGQDAREAINEVAHCSLDEIAEFRKAFAELVNDRVSNYLTEATKTLWLPEAAGDAMKEPISSVIMRAFDDEAQDTMGVTFDE